MVWKNPWDWEETGLDTDIFKPRWQGWVGGGAGEKLWSKAMLGTQVRIRRGGGIGAGALRDE